MTRNVRQRGCILVCPLRRQPVSAGENQSTTALERNALQPQLAYAVEKLDRRLFGNDCGGLKPSPNQFASL
jgi:hypothetical protein